MATIVSPSSPDSCLARTMSSMVLGDVWSDLERSSRARPWSPDSRHASATSRTRNAGAPGRSLAYIMSAECQSPSSTDILADASMKSLSPEA